MKEMKRISLAIKKMYNNLMNKDKKLLLMIYIYMFSFAIFDFIVAIFPKVLLDLYIDNKVGQELLMMVVSFLIMGCILGWTNSLIRENASARISYLRIDYLAEAFNKIITSDYKNMEDATFFNKYDSAFDACSNVESGMEKVYNILFDVPALTMKIILFSCVLCRFSPFVLFAVILHTAVSVRVKKKSASYKYMYREKFSKINRKKRYFKNISQDFQYGKDIRLYNLKTILNEKYFYEINQYKLLFRKIKNREFLLKMESSITMIICDIVIYGVLIFEAINNISISDVTMYFIVVNILKQAVELFVVDISDIYGEGLFIADYFDFISANLCKNDGSDLELFDGKNIGIQITNFSFKYPNTDRYIIKNLNLDIAPGEKIALVGNNGVGKSTLIKVIVGLYRDFEGDIQIGGKSIKDVGTKSLFSKFSVVFQDVNLLAYTVSENITGSSEEGEKCKIWEVLEKVGMKKKIEETTKGLEHQIHRYIDEDGLELSGGESQKLAIARAIYKDAEIFVLDEPTASLDALAEKEIYEKFGEITKEKTTIFISHRLASTKFCDRIILLGRDGVLEQGTHKELMSLRGEYFEMFTLQGKYYQEKRNEKD